MNKSVSGEEVLSLPWRFESLHSPLAPVDVSSRPGRSSALPMFNLGKELAARHTVASQLVGHAHARDILKVLQRPSKETLRGFGIPPRLNT